MKLVTAQSSLKDEADAVGQIKQKIAKSGQPKLLVFTCTVAYDVDRVYSLIRQEFSDIPIQGGTSCSAIMTDDGYISQDGRAVAAMGFYDEDCEFGVGSEDKGDDPKAAAKKALEEAIDNADRSGELPNAVWLICSPGGEEQIIEGLTESLGEDFPLIGGSSADNTIEGHWKQFSHKGVHDNNVTVVAIFDDNKVIATSFHSGYDPSKNIGKVTKAGDRVIFEIDNKPAAEVYNEWSQGAIKDQMAGGQILAASNVFPIGRKVGKISNLDYYCLSHPETVTENKGITVFTDIFEGEEITCMTGSVDLLVARAGNVVHSALETESLSKDQITGAMIIFCAGCMMTIGDRMPEAAANLKKELGEGVPFFSMFTFGEQGSLAGGENRHGNLMISVLLFTSKEI